MNPVCLDCGIELNDSNWHPSARITHHYICKSCVAKRFKKNHPDGRRDYQRRWASKNKDKVSKYNKQWHDNNREKVKEIASKFNRSPRGILNHWRYKLKGYGITVEDYNRMLERQGNRCAICGTLSGERKGIHCLCVDHDHNTNKVRGLLCHDCNRALGSFNTIDRLKRAVKYLEEGGPN